MATGNCRFLVKWHFNLIYFIFACFPQILFPLTISWHIVQKWAAVNHGFHLGEGGVTYLCLLAQCTHIRASPKYVKCPKKHNVIKVSLESDLLFSVEI